MYSKFYSLGLANLINAEIGMCYENTERAQDMLPHLNRVHGVVKFKDGHIVWNHYWLTDRFNQIIDPTYALLDYAGKIESYKPTIELEV